MNHRTYFGTLLIIAILSGLLACLYGCNEQQAVNYEDIIAQINKLDPNQAAALTADMFSQQQKAELQKIKLKAEAKAYERQERYKLLCIAGIGASVIIIVAGIWFGKKYIIGSGIAGVLGCGVSLGLIFAGLEYGKLIGLVFVILFGLMAILLFAAFVYSVFKHRTALFEVISSIEFAKDFEPKVKEVLKQVQKDLPTQSVQTEKIVDKIKKNGVWIKNYTI